MGDNDRVHNEITGTVHGAVIQAGDLGDIVLTGQRPPTLAEVLTDPEYWLGGAGRDAARTVFCPHDYRLTDSCPNC